ncbi:MAG TPA: HEAT repeat domain-containing protein [Candidatus Limnocylindrales bacterium]|nr:HEAT repeat domain-containing protein [Candidatus Limnocylindrales bacterium]
MSMGRHLVRVGAICFTAAMLNLAIGTGAVAALQGGGRGQSTESIDENQDEKHLAERDHQAEARDMEQERAERMQELYDEGREALDEDQFREAERSFTELVRLNGPQTDAALYWMAYAQNREGKKEASLGTIAELKKRYPQSRWKKDGEALEIEVRSSTGSKANPEAQNDEDLKLLALQGLMNSNPEKAMPLVEGILNGAGSPRMKSKALFVLAQNGSPQAEDVLGKIARGQSNPDLQRKAVSYLATFGGTQAGKILAEVYRTSNDLEIKRAVIRSYIISGDHEQLGALAKGEANAELRKEAIRNLGIVGGQADLQALYVKETDRSVKEEIINAYFIGGDAKELIATARAEKDPELKKKAVEKLSLMGSKEANDYLMELLQK